MLSDIRFEKLITLPPISSSSLSNTDDFLGLFALVTGALLARFSYRISKQPSKRN